MNRNFHRTWILLAAAGVFVAACRDNNVEPTPGVAPGQTPLFGLTTPENGPGACMGTDTYNFGQAYNATAGFAALQISSPSDLNCTANDIDIAIARIKSYSFDGINFTELPTECLSNPTLPQCRISCTVNQTIYANVIGIVVNSAQERYDVGIWIGNDQDQAGGALSGASCDHFNLVTPGNDGSVNKIYSIGVSNLDDDSCGDMKQRDTARVDLGLRTFGCEGSQANSTQVSIPACLGWSNSNTGAKQRTCPVVGNQQKGPNAGQPLGSTSLGYRYGTTPTEAPKCNCEPMILPIDIKASLTLVKVVTNDNGGTATVTDFPLTATGPNTISGVSGTTAVTDRPVSAGTYTLSEQTLANYSKSTWSCSGGTQSGSNITLAATTSATCTITNNDDPAHLTLVKTITNDNGGTKTTADFTLTAAGPVTISGTSGNSAVTNAIVSAGLYNLSETAVSGYTAGAWSCTSGGSGSTVTLGLGGSATCTINNDDNAPSLTLVKVVTNDNGGTATTANFPLTAAGPVTISGASGSSAVTNAIVSAGVYNLSETTVAGYTQSAWSCTSGGSASTVTLGLGGSATCTIGNNDAPPHLTLVKVVTNDNGGTATAASFPLTAAGPIPPSCSAGSTSGASGSANVTNKELCAGVYTLSEQTVSGYSAGSWSCTSGGSANTVTLALGGAATCTIGNDDVAPRLTLVKVVTNDDGGTLTTSSFPLTAAGPVTISGTSGAGAVTNALVSAGTYDLSETQQAGYTASSWGCSSGGSGSQVTLNVGGSSTCTIGNNDIGASLTLVKVVTNDNGGTKQASDFPLTAAGPTTVVGPGSFSVPAGQYNLSETTLAGYQAGLWSCTSGLSGTHVTLGLNGSSTCTIGNNDVGPKLTLVKTVTNDDGGTKTTGDFPLRAAGPVTISGASGSGTVTNAIVNAGTYNLSETTLAGYQAGSWACTTGGSGSTVSLALGESSTCTINNNDVGASLTLVKVVTNDNGGTKTTADFPLAASGPGILQVIACSGVSPVTCSVSAGSYALSETTVAGYQKGLWSCTSGGGTDQVTLGLGGSSTCTIGNDDIGPTLTLVKTVTNDHGGTKSTADFPLTAAGPVTITGTSGSGSVTGAIVHAGTYNLSETTAEGYTKSSWSCTSGGSGGTQVNLALGGSSTCTINNNDDAAHLTLVKVVTNDNGGTKSAADFPLTAAGPVTISGASGSGAVTNAAVSAGTYNLSETTLTGYTKTTWSCTSGGNGSQVTLGLGGSATCTIGNTDDPVYLTLVKTITNDNGGTKTIADFPLRAAGPVTISGTSGSSSVTNAIVSAGTYALSETTQSGYTAGSWSCNSGTLSGSNLTLPLGGSATCTINNNDDLPPGRGSIAPTQTTCEDFATNSYTPLSALYAQLTRDGTINNVSPGVFFYYAEITNVNGAIGFTQTVTPGTKLLPKYQVQQEQAFLYTYSASTGKCTRVATLTLDGNGGGSGGSLNAGTTYYLGVKFSTDAPKGTTNVPVSPSLISTHNFQLTNGASQASIETQVKP